MLFDVFVAFVSSYKKTTLLCLSVVNDVSFLYNSLFTIKLQLRATYEEQSVHADRVRLGLTVKMWLTAPCWLELTDCAVISDRFSCFVMYVLPLNHEGRQKTSYFMCFKMLAQLARLTRTFRCCTWPVSDHKTLDIRHQHTHIPIPETVALMMEVVRSPETLGHFYRTVVILIYSLTELLSHI
jgi:hypothetical protein